MSQVPHVVLVGGGFGGLYAARGLAGAPIRLTLVDKHNYHLFRPMLYQVATGLLSADEIAAPIRAVLRSQKNVEVLMSEVVGVDTAGRTVKMTDGSLRYDYLILATGIRYNYFGHDDWQELAPGLDSVDDADRIRGKILTAFETAERKAEAGADAEEIADLLRFVLVGGGTAGVEMAGTIAEMARLALTGDFRHIDPRSAHILLFEAAPRILPTYLDDLSDRSREHLQQIGVYILIRSDHPIWVWEIFGSSQAIASAPPL
jgi:NADH dehydrogenase